ncbi:MAG: hypothetical protein ACI9ZD_002937 [Paracoccaceae bacterium]|jgi:hypothetical protein
MFQNNVGGVDRIVRAIIGLALIAAVFMYPDLANWKWVTLFIGLYLMFTSIISTCVIYSVLGMTTNTNSEEEDI